VILAKKLSRTVFFFSSISLIDIHREIKQIEGHPESNHDIFINKFVFSMFASVLPNIHYGL
jgi:hypothetical protein